MTAAGTDGALLLRARDLHLAYDDVVVLSGVDLDLSPGELVVVSGEDGCGTSSLLRMLAGELEAGGTVDAGGTADGSEPPGSPRVALLPQPPGDDWAAHEVAAHLLGAAGLGLLERLAAAHLAEREMWTLSGGERQRVRLARAFADPAPVLLLDEPLGYLDRAGARTALAVLREQAAAGRAVVAVVKGDPVAEAAADRLLVLEGGRLVPSARPAARP